MKLSVSHRTAYAYKLPVAQSHHLIHLQPRVLARQAVLNHSLLIDPAPKTRNDVRDTFGNAGVLLKIDDEHTEFVVHARSTVTLSEGPQFDLQATLPWESVASQLAIETENLEAAQFSCGSRHTPSTAAIRAFARASFSPGRPIMLGAMDLTRRIHTEFKFDPTATDTTTPVTKVLTDRRGVCQDFAHLAIAAVRSLGLSARYVSGYLLTRPPPGQPKLMGADASHAWLSVWSRDTGWVDFDPTNGIIPGVEHITVAYGRDYDDICPISGVLLGGGDQTMTVAVDVEPVV